MSNLLEESKMLREEEYKYQRLADSAKIAQRSVETLANLIGDLVDLVRESHPDEAICAERCLSRIPHLRKMPIDHRDKEFRYVMEISYPLSPIEEFKEKAEMKYLRELSEARWGIPPDPWRFVKEPK